MNITPEEQALIDSAQKDINIALKKISQVNKQMCAESRWFGQVDVAALENNLYTLLKSQTGSIGGLVTQPVIYDEFWDFVEIADYAGANFDSDISKNNIDKFTKEKMEFFHKIFTGLINKLKSTYQKLDYRIGFGDDGMNDLYAYIISQGKKEYQKYIDNPEKFKEWNINSWKPESFSYIFN